MNATRLVLEIEIVADWRDGLADRIDRAQALLETDGLTIEAHDALISEASHFIRVCDAIAGNMAAER